MIAGNLMQRLLDIDKAIAQGNLLLARTMIADTEDFVLALERETIDTLREVRELRARLETLNGSSLRRRFLSRLHSRESAAHPQPAPPPEVLARAGNSHK
jgi:hypothetical protein